MNLEITDQTFLVCGASSGFGKAVSEALVAEGAKVIAVARGEEKLQDLVEAHPGRVEGLAADMTRPETIGKILQKIEARDLGGALINAGGPPAKSFLETALSDWDAAYRSLLRWKVALTQALLPKMIGQQYGRLLFVESVSVKQPIENLVLSNSLRLAVVGFVKTLSQEIADQGLTMNIIAPGYHDTPAMERLFAKRSESQRITVEEARAQFEAEIKTGSMGTPADFASLAVWMLSPASRYITGQTISVDGGLVKGVMG